MKNLYYWDLCNIEFRTLLGVGCSETFISMLLSKFYHSKRIAILDCNVLSSKCGALLSYNAFRPAFTVATIVYNHCCCRHRQQHPLLLRDGSWARCRGLQAVVVCRYILKAHASQRSNPLCFYQKKCLDFICLDTDQCPTTMMLMDQKQKKTNIKLVWKFLIKQKKIEFTTYTLFITNLLADTINKTLQ